MSNVKLTPRTAQTRRSDVEAESTEVSQSSPSAAASTEVSSDRASSESSHRSGRAGLAGRNAARAGAMASGAQLQAELQKLSGAEAQGMAGAELSTSDLAAFADFVTLFTQLFEKQIHGMMGDLGFNLDSLEGPEAEAAIKQIKDYAGMSPNGNVDFDLMIALMMAQAEKDRYGSGGGGGGPKGHETGSGTGGIRLDQTKPVDAANWKAGSGDVTPEQLVAIASKSGHKLSAKRAAEVAPHVNRAMAEAQIDTPKKKAAFLAQLMHESAGFKYNEEIASGANYEGRRDLGNTQPGDGKRFKGRGFIQLTGRANYAAAGKALGLDLIKHPELAASDEHAGRVAAWYWNSRGLNGLAEQGKFDKITKRINGGYNGKADRDRLYGNALEILKDNHGLPSTGQVAETAPMTSPDRVSATDGMNEAQKYEYYRNLISNNGGTVNNQPGQRNIVGLRTENQHTNRYDDRMAVIWKDADGNPRVREFDANMESNSNYQGRFGRDVNGDGSRDLATLSTGTHTFARGRSGKFGNILRPTTATAVMRDTDRDGKGDTLDRTGAGTSVLFHKGGRKDTGSAGCQTMDPATFNAFWNTLGSQRNFQYTVVNVD